MILKDLEIGSDKFSDRIVYGIRAYVIIKRENKLWKIRHVRKYESDDDNPKKLFVFIKSFIEESNKIYHLWKLNPVLFTDLYGKIIGELPFEIEDEEITKEQYEERFGKDSYVI